MIGYFGRSVKEGGAGFCSFSTDLGADCTPKGTVWCVYTESASERPRPGSSFLNGHWSIVCQHHMDELLNDPLPGSPWGNFITEDGEAISIELSEEQDDDVYNLVEAHEATASEICLSGLGGWEIITGREPEPGPRVIDA